MLFPVKCDLDVFPKNIFQPVSAATLAITLGDMHGNTKKLFWSLLKAGAIKMDEAVFNRLVFLYNNWIPRISFSAAYSDLNTMITDAEYTFLEDGDDDNLTLKLDSKINYVRNVKQEIATFREILEQVTFVPTVKVRLLGDMLADRGKCDYLTLLFIKKAKESNLNITIIESNHDFQLQQKLSPAFKNTKPTIINNDSICDIQRASWLGLKKLIAIGCVSEQEAQALMSIYQENIKLIDYEWAADEDRLDIFMHAPNNTFCIDSIVAEFRVIIAQESNKHPAELQQFASAIANLKLVKNSQAGELIETIDTINKIFSYLINQYPYIEDGFIEKLCSQTILSVLWNKRNIEPTPTGPIKRLFHAHIGEKGLNNSWCKNLDNDVGKAIDIFPDQSSCLFGVLEAELIPRTYQDTGTIPFYLSELTPIPTLIKLPQPGTQ
jgi:hypothetical protein